MTAYVIGAFLSPLVVGLAVPFSLALPGRRWIRAGIVAAAVAVPLSFGGIGLGIYLATLALFMAGLYEAIRSARAPAVVAQIGCSVVILLMIASLFGSDPFIQAADRPQDLVPVFLSLEPMAAVASAIGAGDPLRFDEMYGISRLADYGRNDTTWGGASLWMAILGGLLLALSQWPRLIVKRKDGSVQPPGPVQADRPGGAEADRP